MRYWSPYRSVSGSSSEPPSHHNYYRSDVQALRGVAVLLVVLYHAKLGLSGGFIGVDAFFVISGYVITGSLLRDLEQSGSISLPSFYTRRALRLLPSLALVTVVVLAASVILLPFTTQAVSAGTALAATLFAANIYLYRNGGNYFDEAVATNPFLHTWSLGIEEQFYLVLPSMIIVLLAFARVLRIESQRRLMGVVFGVLALTSFWWSWQTAESKGLFANWAEFPERFAFYMPVTRAWQLLAGVLLALAPTPRMAHKRAAGVMRGAGFGALLAASLAFDSKTPFPGAAAAVPVLASALILAAGAPLKSRPRVYIALEWTGNLSYSWYLWHWPILVIAARLWPNNRSALVLGACISLVVAWLSSKWVEDPIRFRLPQRKAVIAGIIGASLITPAAAGIIVRSGSYQNWGIEPPPGMKEMPLARGVMDCYDTGTNAWPAERCTIRSEKGRGLILLLGDSHAASASDGVAKAAANLGMDFGVWAEPGCPFILDRAPFGYPSCKAWQVRALAAIDRYEPNIVVIANRSVLYTETPNEDTRFPIETSDRQRPTSKTDALTSWGEGLEQLLKQLSLRRSPPRVVLIANVPEFPTPDFSLMNRAPAPSTVTLSDLSDRREVVELETDIVVRFSRAEVFDPTTVLCTVSHCRNGSDDEWWYFDGDHLNARGSLRLAHELTMRLRDSPLD